MTNECLNCNKILSHEMQYEKFCSQKCLETFFYSDDDYQESLRKKECLVCRKILSRKSRIYCSLQCHIDDKWQKAKEELINLGEDTSNANSIGKKYLIELHNGACQICKLNTWQGKEMPLVLDHIDGNPYNNMLINLRIICNNCDAQTEFFKGKNRGRGRVNREKYYKEFKELKDENDLHKKSLKEK